jgi:hypothetical protein
MREKCKKIKEKKDSQYKQYDPSTRPIIFCLHNVHKMNAPEYDIRLNSSKRLVTERFDSEAQRYWPRLYQNRSGLCMQNRVSRQ